MAIKKSDLYSSIWSSCDALRGGMDPSLYKDYVLFMLFIKYVSDKYGDADAHTSMSTQALNSETVRRGIKDILLSHAKLWEALRNRPAA